MHTPIGFHVMMRLDDGRVIATSAAAYRTASAAILAQGEHRGLIAFRVVDTHLHALLVCGRDEAGAFARYAGGSLVKRLGLGARFSPARFEEVRSQAHLVNVFRYVLRQERRHGLDADPFHDGSSLADLIGLRVIAPWLAPRVRAHLPRLTWTNVLESEGVPDVETLGTTEPATAHLADAAAAAFALPALDGRRTPVVRARRAAAQAGPPLDLDELGAVLGISRSTACRLFALPPTKSHVLAVRMQAALREAQSLVRKGPAPPDARRATRY